MECGEVREINLEMRSRSSPARDPDNKPRKKSLQYADWQKKLCRLDHLYTSSRTASYPPFPIPISRHAIPERLEPAQLPIMGQFRMPPPGPHRVPAGKCEHNIKSEINQKGEVEQHRTDMRTDATSAGAPSRNSLRVAAGSR